MKRREVGVDQLGRGRIGPDEVMLLIVTAHGGYRMLFSVAELEMSPERIGRTVKQAVENARASAKGADR